MDDKELEKILKDSANKIEMKSFSSRWKEIKAQIPKSKKDERSIKYVVALISFLCLTIIVAIMIPMFLQPTEEKRYFSVSEISYEEVTREQFYSELDSIGMEILNIREFAFDVYSLARTSDSIVRGGSVTYENTKGDAAYIFSITFFTSDVLVDETEYSDLRSEVIVKECLIKYKTTNEGLYQSTALMKFKDTTYIINYSSLNDDLTVFLDQLIN